MASLSNRPLLSTSDDRHLVVERPGELAMIEDGVRRGLNVLVCGAPGSGLTTAVHQVLRRLPRGDEENPRFVNAAGIDSTEQLLHEALGALVPAMAIVGSKSAYTRFARFTALPGKIVILLDNAGAGLLLEAFGQFRDELWQVPVTWVVACSEHDRAQVLAGRSATFFDLVVELGPLTDVQSASLLRKRATKDELNASGLRAAVLAGAGNPRALVRAARRLVLEGLDPAELTRSEYLRAEVGRMLSRPARMLLDELVARGPSSASDPQLQAATGWTRSRLVQVFAELESAHAVESVERTEGRSGRPRKVYRSRY